MIANLRGAVFQRPASVLVFLCGWGLALTVNAWDFQYGYRTVFDTQAVSYVVEQTNIQRTHESSFIAYWNPIANGTEARLTQRFPFPKRTAQAFLYSLVATYNFGGGRSGFGSLWGSKDGTNWVLLLDAPTPTGIDAYYSYSNSLPQSVMGSTEIWIQTRLQTSGWNIMAQFDRLDTRYFPSDFQIFALNVSCVPDLSIQSAVALQWVTISNQVYQVQTSTDLTNWTDFGGVIITPPRTTNTVYDIASDQKKFYRLSVQ